MKDPYLYSGRETLINMKRVAILLCIVVMIMALTACTGFLYVRNIPDIPVEHVFVPIEGVGDAITASGYIEIQDSRYNPNPPTAVFNPYPGYFHLFPFAILGDTGIPVFVLTNEVYEIFEALELSREDVPSDRFGNQWLNNVRAVFGGFATQKLVMEGREFELDIVYADIISVIDNVDGDFWEIVPADFVLVTNGDRTIEPVELRVGDDFSGLTLTRIESSQIYMKNGEIFHQYIAEAEFSGKITLGGDITIGLRFDSEYRVDAGFTVADAYLSLLPRIADFSDRIDSFSITNVDELMLALDVTRNELDVARSIKVEGISATFEIVWISSFGYVANFVELL